MKTVKQVQRCFLQVNIVPENFNKSESNDERQYAFRGLDNGNRSKPPMMIGMRDSNCVCV